MRKSYGMKWLCACASLAAGEFAASRAPHFAEAWPCAALAAAFVALFGYGTRCRALSLASLVLAGVALFLFSSIERERELRLRPWMRNARTFQSASRSAGGALSPMRAALSRKAGIGLRPRGDAAALGRAILLGERRGVPQRLRSAFLAAGTTHVFAISGLHVMAIAHTLYWLLRIVFVPRRLAGAAAIPILWAYVWVIGMPPSAVRAALMATFYCAAPVFRRKPDGVMAWALSFLVVYVADPSMITNIGCGLSFAVMLAILLAIGNMPSCTSAFGATLRVSFSAWAAGTPIVGYAFGRMTPGGIVASLAVIPTACAAVVSGFLGLLASFVSLSLAEHLNNLSALFTGAMVAVSEATARLPGASFSTGRWPLWLCCIWYAAAMTAAACLRILRNRRLKRPF